MAKIPGKPANGPAKAARKQARRKVADPQKVSPTKKPTTPKLLSGGNPQIPKGAGDGPVAAYIEALPGWKSDVGRLLDSLIERAVPGVRKAIKWNSPLYGVDDEAFFLGIHAFTNYLKVAFFNGSALLPVPPGTSKQQHVRYLDIHQDSQLDQEQFLAWVKQASELPGVRM